MTEADRDGQQAFTACLDKTGDDEESCIEALGHHAWYPRDDATCTAVAARVHAALPKWHEAKTMEVGKRLALNDAPEMRDLYFNERCARLGMQHNATAAITPDMQEPREKYDLCMAENAAELKSPAFFCSAQLAKFEYYPADESACKLRVSEFNTDFELGRAPDWSGWFENERCRRWGLPYVDIWHLKLVVGPDIDDAPGMESFLSCLDDNRQDEEVCLRYLGKDGWYPRNDEVCANIAARIDRILAVDGDPRWRALFQNERCARLEMPHSSSALPDKRAAGEAEGSVDCRKWKFSLDCEQTYGPHEWNPVGSKGVCEFQATSPVIYPSSEPEWWVYWFQNERCRRVGKAYYDSLLRMAVITHAILMQPEVSTDGN